MKHTKIIWHKAKARRYHKKRWPQRHDIGKKIMFKQPLYPAKKFKYPFTYPANMIDDININSSDYQDEVIELIEAEPSYSKEEKAYWIKIAKSVKPIDKDRKEKSYGMGYFENSGEKKKIEIERDKRLKKVSDSAIDLLRHLEASRQEQTVVANDATRNKIRLDEYNQALIDLDLVDEKGELKERYGKPEKKRSFGMLGALYPTKKELKENIGKELRFVETSMFGPEYKPDGELVVVGPDPYKDRKWYAQVKMKEGKIESVK